jgi:hypothetical protein
MGASCSSVIDEAISWHWHRMKVRRRCERCPTRKKVAARHLLQDCNCTGLRGERFWGLFGQRSVILVERNEKNGTDKNGTDKNGTDKNGTEHGPNVEIHGSLAFC